MAEPTDMGESSMHTRLRVIIERAILGRTATQGARAAADAILPLIAEAVAAERERHLHRCDEHPKVWCETCQHEHIQQIPQVTFACKACGWGQWYSGDALIHEAATGHETYEIRHQLAAICNPEPREEGPTEKCRICDREEWALVARSHEVDPEPHDTSKEDDRG